MVGHAAIVEPGSSPSDLRRRWLSLKAADPGLRARDGASRLGVSEAELVASRCGDGVIRLDGPWTELVRELPSLGIVMALTRNESIVHEKIGRYGNVSIFENTGLVLNQDIDLRIFFDHWNVGFAVDEETRSGSRRSLQFFDSHGTAVHKVYVREGSDEKAFEELARAHRHADQSPGQTVLPTAKPAVPRPDSKVDRIELRRRWRALEDPHDFHAMLKDLGMARVQALRLAGDGCARRVGNGSFAIALENAAATRMGVMVFAGSPAVIQIHTGPVQRLKRTGPWFNVLDSRFSLHLREDRIASSWVVRKPSEDGIVTSLEIYDARERQIAWLFGERKPGQAEQPRWCELTRRLDSCSRRGHADARTSG